MFCMGRLGFDDEFKMLHFSCDILRHQKIDFIFLLANHACYICSNFSTPLKSVNFFSALFNITAQMCLEKLLNCCNVTAG